LNARYQLLIVAVVYLILLVQALLNVPIIFFSLFGKAHFMNRNCLVIYQLQIFCCQSAEQILSLIRSNDEKNAAE